MSNLAIRAPHPGEWIRVNPDPAYRKEVTLTRDEKGEPYLIVEHLAKQLMLQAAHDDNQHLLQRLEPSMLFLAQNREGETFIWPVRKPVPEQHLAYQAMADWICFPTMN